MSTDRIQTAAEEIANGITHGIGAIASLVGLILMVVRAASVGDVNQIVSASVFGCSLVLVYVASTLYHSLAHSRARGALQIFDHIAIYCLIAGTYTPFGLVALPGAWGWTVFGGAWGMAAIGIGFKAIFGARFHFFSTAMYLLMGWIGVAAAVPIWHHVSGGGIGWLISGGLAYTSGVGFFLWNRLPFHHTIWHLFVIAGSACHFMAVFGHVLG